jgi:hypothetical protein
MATAMDIVEVPDYVSDEEISTSEPASSGNTNTVKKRQRRWVKDMVFNNAVEATEAVMKENQWSHHYTNTTAEGKKKYFRCNKVKFRGKQCDTGIYLLFNSTSDEVTLYRAKSNHTHDQIQEKTSAITNEVKEVIMRV